MRRTPTIPLLVVLGYAVAAVLFAVPVVAGEHWKTLRNVYVLDLAWVDFGGLYFSLISFFLFVPLNAVFRSFGTHVSTPEAVAPSFVLAGYVWGRVFRLLWRFGSEWRLWPESVWTTMGNLLSLVAWICVGATAGGMGAKLFMPAPVAEASVVLGATIGIVSTLILSDVRGDRRG